MKKVLFILLLVTLTASVFAGEVIGKGVKGGLNFANLSGEDVDNDMEMKMGIALGGFLTYKINDNLAIQPEIYYTQKGSYFEESGYEVTYTYNYIEIPILFKVPVSQFSLFAGPALSYNLDAEVEVDSDWDSGSGKIEDNRDTLLEFVLGAEININENILLDARYDMGLSSNDNSTEGFAVHNRVFSIMAGYRF